MKQGPSFVVKQGSLIALACAAAFALPQVAQAADSFPILKADGHPLTLQGNISTGYARSESKGGPAGTDVSEHGNVWSGESNIRFSASTKLGGDFIQGVGFQVESGYETSDGTLSASQGELASRNTGLGLKTSIGSIWGGKWDTPMKQVISQFQLTASPQGFGASTTGWYGTPGLGGGSFTGSLATTTCSSGTGTCTAVPAQLGNPTPYAPGVANTSVANTMNFRRRQANTLNYYSPSISGFQVGFQYGVDEAGNVAVPSGAGGGGAASLSAATAKPTMWSATVGYFAGPLTVAAAYERHEDYLWGSAVGTKLGTVNAGLGSTSSDHAFNLGASYQFGPVLVSGFWERLDYSQSGTTGTGVATGLQSIEGQKYYLGARWVVSGPHAIMGAYGKANGLSCEGTAAWQAASTCNDTGAKFYLAHYRYQLDKVSYLNVTYSKTDNDKNGNFVGTNSAGTTGAGHTDQGWSVGVNTSF